MKTFRTVQAGLSGEFIRKFVRSVTVKNYCVFLLCINILFLIFPGTGSAEKSPYDWALIQLDYVRKEKMSHLQRFTGKLHGVAKEAAGDKRILSFFEMNRYYHKAVQGGSVPESLTTRIESLRSEFNRYYIKDYFVFYDILFVDSSGEVFYTVRKERDAYANVTENEELFGELGKVLMRKPDKETFIDFYHYKPSSEPAAFFVEPVYRENTLDGWIVLQCAVNKLNTIFAPTGDMGQTGESFLVNKDGLMLSESYFKGTSTILKQHLDDRNIKSKFNQKSGHLEVVDYRGAKVLTSFEVLEFLETKWLVVAKIDKDEVATDHYLKHSKYYNSRLMDYLQKSNPPRASPVSLSPASGNPLRVDIDEFLKASYGEKLETWGVSTCTAFVATVPEKFAYLAHISSKDRVYGGSETNMLGQITKKVKTFDIYPYQRNSVQFFVVAPHLESIAAIISHLAAEGFFLSQIYMGYNPSAKSAAVTSDYEQGSLRVTWKMADATYTAGTMDSKQFVNIGEILHRFIDGV